MRREKSWNKHPKTQRHSSKKIYDRMKKGQLQGQCLQCLQGQGQHLSLWSDSMFARSASKAKEDRY